MDEYAKHSNHRRSNGNRRSSIGCTAEFKGRSSPYCHRAKLSCAVPPESDTEGEDLSECSTIISSLELSASSLFSEKDSKRQSHSLPFPFEEEDETSGRVLKDSILYQYCNTYASPNPKKDTVKLNTSPSMQQKMRLNGLEQASGESQLSPQPKKKPDRRKMMSRWASTGHLCPSDDESDPADKEARDKPPTTPVRRSRGNLDPVIPDALPLTDKAPKVPNRRSHFARRASTGVMADGQEMVVQLHQKKETFETPVSPGMNDKAPACPDRRSQFRRRNSTGSSDSLEHMLVSVIDEDDETESEKQKYKSPKHKKQMKEPTDNKSVETKTSRKSKSKKKTLKEKKNKSEKKERAKKKEKDSSKSTNIFTESPPKRSSGRRSSLQNQSLLSLLGQSTSTLLKQSAYMFDAPAADQVPMSRPYRTFSRRASTPVFSGEGVGSMPTKTKVGGTTATPSELQSSRTPSMSLRSKAQRKS